LAKVETHDPPLWVAPLFDLLEGLHAALHLCGLGGMRGELIDEALLLQEHRLAPCDAASLLAMRIARSRS
jgi:hypothetical protein